MLAAGSYLPFMQGGVGMLCHLYILYPGSLQTEKQTPSSVFLRNAARLRLETKRTECPLDFRILIWFGWRLLIFELTFQMTQKALFFFFCFACTVQSAVGICISQSWDRIILTFGSLSHLLIRFTLVCHLSRGAFNSRFSTMLIKKLEICLIYPTKPHSAARHSPKFNLCLFVSVKQPCWLF